MKIVKVEVFSSAERAGSVWLCKAGVSETFMKVLLDTEQSLRPRSGVAIIIRREP